MRESIRRRFATFLVVALAAALSACNGGSGSSGGANGTALMPPVTNNASDPFDMFPERIGPVNIYPGEVVGRDNAFAPADGDTKDGGHGQKVGATTCDKVEHVSLYHIHAYLGLIVNGKQVAIPDAIGMMRPASEKNGYIPHAGCFYWIHTHDASGMIHIEDPRNFGPGAVKYTLGSVLAVWGISHSATSFGAFQGPVHVFAGNVPLKTVTVSSYSEFMRDPKLIPLHSHTAIWVEVGKTYLTAKQLPSVTFYTEY